MTVAVCFRCGEMKHGAFVPCPSCGTGPRSHDDYALSLALTDQYHDEAARSEMGASIRGGRPVRLDPESGGMYSRACPPQCSGHSLG